MNRWYVVLIGLAVLVAYFVLAEKDQDNQPFIATTTFDVSADLAGDGESVSIGGRISFSLSASDKEIASGRVRVEGWNIAMFGAPMGPVSGVQQPEPQSGFLGFAVSETEAYLEYDAVKKSLIGQVNGYVDNAYLSRFQSGGGHGLQNLQNDLIETATQEAMLTVALELDEQLSVGSSAQSTLTGRFKGDLRVKALQLEHVTAPAWSLAMVKDFVSIDVASPEEHEAFGSLCVQPYNVAKPPDLVEKSGTGYAFGKPAAESQWDKVDVVFDFQEMLTAIDGQDFWVIDNNVGGAIFDLYGPNEVENCIEVYFVHDFNPYNFLQGGWANGGGTGTAKIVTSDGNQRLGAGPTLLAHELGHVIGLKHPDAEATGTMTPASTGTLMCTSTINEDNPQDNSAENEQNIRNPLLIYSQRPVSLDFDCMSDSDCGEC